MCQETGGCIVIFDFSSDGPFANAAMSTSPNCAMELALLHEIFSTQGNRMKLIVLKDEDMHSNKPILTLLKEKEASQRRQKKLFLGSYEACKGELMNRTAVELLERWMSDFAKAGGDTGVLSGAAASLSLAITRSLTGLQFHD